MIKKEYANVINGGNVHVIFIIKLEIAEVYKGSRWDDTCISDIWFGRKQENTAALTSGEKTEKVCPSDNHRFIYVQTNQRDKTVLADVLKIGEDDYSDFNGALDVVETSPDKKWVIIDNMFAPPPGQGHVIEFYDLYYIPLLKKWTKACWVKIFIIFTVLREKTGKFMLIPMPVKETWMSYNRNWFIHW